MTVPAYADFLATKAVTAPAHGLTVDTDALHPALFPWQREIVRWALHRGRAALFEDCGLGKTLQQLVWADAVSRATGQPVLILAPLAVAAQTAAEGARFNLPVTICRTQDDVQPGINITNYEMLDHFIPAPFAGLVLDESSILKSYSGVLRRAITAFGSGIPYRLAATATPAPNDLIEIINHAEFLGIMQSKEIIALYFTQDGNTTHAWRLKGHARRDFWRWLASWAVALRRPSDLGYSDTGFLLPPLQVEQVTVEGSAPPGMLFATDNLPLAERRAARRASLSARVAACAERVNRTPGPWVVWCDLNDESAALTRAIPGAVEVKGSDPPAHKEAAMLDFAAGRIRVLVSKPSICGWGMNWQHCAAMAFVGLSDSWEQQYQAIRRCWRFGQTRPVAVWMYVSESEGAVVRNLERKGAQAAEMMEELVSHMKDLTLDRADRQEMTYETTVRTGEGWTLYLGDCVEQIDQVADQSVGFSIFSPPFPGMYAYTNSMHDMGNTRDGAEMLTQFGYLIGKDKLLRVMMPGRTVAVHVTDSPAFKGVDGYVGLKDFSGDVIRVMEGAGWIYYGRITIDKDPQVKAQRTKDASLQFKSLATDSARLRPAMPDYLLLFHAPGDNPAPIRAGVSTRYANPDGWVTNDEWIEWAHPIWYGIRETRVLNVVQARETDDERHLCPLQLDVIERAIKLWSAPGELVLSPFAGIGSEGYSARLLGRRFVGIELKRSYWASACANLERANAERAQQTMTALLPGFAEVA
jgi:DNA modification methylase